MGAGPSVPPGGPLSFYRTLAISCLVGRNGLPPNVGGDFRAKKRPPTPQALRFRIEHPHPSYLHTACTYCMYVLPYTCWYIQAAPYLVIPTIFGRVSPHDPMRFAKLIALPTLLASTSPPCEPVNYCFSIHCVHQHALRGARTPHAYAHSLPTTITHPLSPTSPTARDSMPCLSVAVRTKLSSPSPRSKYLATLKRPP